MQETRSIQAAEIQRALAAWRARVARRLLRISSVLMLPAFASIVATIADDPGSAIFSPLTLFYAVALLGIFYVAWARNIPTSLRAGVLVAIAVALGAFSLLIAGLASNGRLLLFVAPVIALILLGDRWGIAAAVIGVLVVAGFGIAFTHGGLSPRVADAPFATEPITWVRAVVVTIALQTAILLPVARLLRGQMFAMELSVKNEALEHARREQNVANERLARARDAAESAATAKSAFLANMSHEIRTPLNGVIGMTEVLLESKMSDEQRDVAATIMSSGEALLAIISDVLDFSKIESGRLELEHRAFDLRSCVEQTLRVVAAPAETKGLVLAYEMAPDVPEVIIGDVTRLRQVLTNLLGNAVKFTERGDVIIAIRRAGGAGERHELEFVVTDTGIGIPPDRRDRLFESFAQVDASTTRKYGGTGLGLTIAKQLVELMEGEIRVESEPGRGSRFVFTILAKAGPRHHASLPVDLGGLRTKRLLLVSNHERSRGMLERQLTAWQLRVDGATSSSVLDDPTIATDYDVVYVDQTEDAEAVVAAVEPLRAPLLVAQPFTSQSVPSSEDRLVEYLRRPFRATRLVQALEHACKVPRTVRPVSSTAVPLEPSPTLRILLAEDNVVNQRVAAKTLEHLGYEATVVSNGLEALAALESEHFDIVLMDVQMPEMDGLEASRRIRDVGADLSSPWIIAMTANARREDRELCITAGMNDYLSKPVRRTDLSAALERAQVG